MREKVKKEKARAAKKKGLFYGAGANRRREGKGMGSSKRGKPSGGQKQNFKKKERKILGTDIANLYRLRDLNSFQFIAIFFDGSSRMFLRPYFQRHGARIAQ